MMSFAQHHSQSVDASIAAHEELIKMLSTMKGELAKAAQAYGGARRYCKEVHNVYSGNLNDFYMGISFHFFFFFVD